MMNRYVWRLSIAMIVVYFIALSTVEAQENAGLIRTAENTTQLMGGVTLSGTLNSYSRGIPMAHQGLCSVLEEGSGVGFTAGFVVEYLLSREFTLSSYIRYGSYPGDFEHGVVVWRRDAQRKEIASVSVVSSVDYQVLEGDLLLKWAFYRFGMRDVVGVAVGPTVSGAVNGTIAQELHRKVYRDGRLISSEDIVKREEPGLQKSLREGQEISGLLPVRYAVRSGVFVNYELNPAISIVPGLYTDYALRAVTNERPYSFLDVAHFQIDVLVAL